MEYIGRKVVEFGLVDTIQETVPSIKAKDRFLLNERRMLNMEYVDLDRAAKAIGLDGVIALFAAVGITTNLSRDDASFLERCKKISETSLQTFTDYLNSGALCAAWWTEADNPTDRMGDYIRNKYERGERRNIDFGANTQTIMKSFAHYYNALSLDEIPDVAKTLGVSLRWLLCVDNNTAIYTNSAAAENLYDIYKLLPEDRQRIIMAFVDAKGG